MVGVGETARLSDPFTKENGFEFFDALRMGFGNVVFFSRIGVQIIQFQRSL